MSPETDVNDHVPLEFLLGTRVRHYLPHSIAKRQGCINQRIFASSIHPRRREEQARQLLQRVLEDTCEIESSSELEVSPATSDRAALLKVINESSSTRLAEQETIFDDDNFQLNIEDARRSPVRIKTLKQLRNDDLRRQQKQVNSFHGYEQENRSFLDVAGAAARIPHTTTRQLRDLKMRVVKAKKNQEYQRTQELVGILQEQKDYTRIALHQHQQFAQALQRQKNPGVVSTSMLTLDTTGQLENGNSTGEMDQHRVMLPLQFQESYYEHHLPEEIEHPRKPVLAKLNFDARILSLSPQKHTRAMDSARESQSVSTATEEDTPDNSESDDDIEQVQKRLGDRQWEIFASSAANGVFYGGGFITKKPNYHHEKKIKPHSISSNSSNRLAQAAIEREFLKTVLDAQSVSILPLAQANKPALRRREASAVRRHSKHHKSPNNR
ncbi:Hypothetical protein PHPALM_37436 [Phytophthora palmivora]|uniref:Uncharacterized protein n=1 Tax=Phytophthora palmivora TaxID=4796 RepID=A0A2P4WXF5_9STRA|nr:Hypothetical protein PHPALM_37436 [Phytophthora palmivora]